MSYDYMLMKGKAAGSLEDLMEGGFGTDTIGPVEEIKASISRLFPSVRWEKGPPLPPGVNLPPGMNLEAWFGLQGPAEFQLSVEPNGQVQMITMSHCDKAEVELVAKELGVVALDEQSMESFGG